MILVASATGILGEEVCRQLVAAGHRVRGLVRVTSDPAKLAALAGIGVELVRADLKDPASLEAACRGARVVISTATSTRSRREGDSISTVDRDGQLNLIEAASAAGVKQFIFVSFPPMGDEFPLQTAKRVAEARLRESGLAATILQPVNFMEVWLSPFVGFDVAGGSARLFGAGDKGNNWISFVDVARFVVAAVDNPGAMNRTFAFGGAENLSQLEVVKIFEELTGRGLTLEHVPVEALRGMLASDDPMQQTAAGLMLNCSRGDALDMEEVLRVLPVQRTTIREFAERVVSQLSSGEAAGTASKRS